MPAPSVGLILHWNCETLTGAQMDDLSPTGNNGTITGTVDRAAGQVGKARGFDGINDKIVADSAPALSSSYTVAIWAKPTVDARLAVALDATGTKYIHYGVIVANRFGYTHNSGATAGLLLTALSANATGAYVHVAIRYNGHSAYLFRNGETQASVAATGTTTWSGFMIGNWAGESVQWAGDLDELRVYSRSLSKSEIQDIYNDSTNYGVSNGGGGADDPQRAWLPVRHTVHPLPRWTTPQGGSSGGSPS